MGGSMSSKAAKRRRKRERDEALVIVAKLSDEELTNMEFELGRELGVRLVALRETQFRIDTIRTEQGRRKVARKVGGEEVRISDHAIVRYLERHKGLDVDGLRDEIAALIARSKPVP